jgi:hypothetical protein
LCVRIVVPTPTLLVTTVIGIDSRSGKPTGRSQRAEEKPRGQQPREQERCYLFHSCLRTVFVGCRLIEYLNT